MAPQLDTVAGLISVSQHFWPTEPDKATVFPAVAGAGEEAAVPTWVRGASSSLWWPGPCRGYMIDSRWQGEGTKRGFKILILLPSNRISS